MKTADILKAHPAAGKNLPDRADLIDKLLACAQACTTCADACTAEDEPKKLTQCIRSDLDCAEICRAAAAVLSRQSGDNDTVLAKLIAACETACRTCAEECEKHRDMHAHCAACADACRECEEACRSASL